MSNAQVLCFAEYLDQARRLAEALGSPCQEVHIHPFPDGERKLRLPLPLAEHVIFCRSLNDPDHKLIELWIAAQAARDNGAQRLTLVAPYLAYMRQDMAFEPGEAISQQSIGRLLAEAFDAVITVDAHLHRIQHLEQAIPLHHAINLSAAEVVGEFLRRRAPRALLLGPDSESEQWVASAARVAGTDYAVARKRRLGDREVEIELPEADILDRQIVLVDDVASTGHTLAATSRQLLLNGASAVHCLVTHGLFRENAITQLAEAGIVNVWSSDSVPHLSNEIHLDELLAAAVRRLG